MSKRTPTPSGNRPLKAIVKRWIKLNALPALRHVAGLSRGIVVIKYHSIQKNPLDIAEVICPSIVHSKKAFSRHMEIVARTCRPGTLDDLTAGLKGAGPLPAKTVVVTFDDGYVDNYELALPVLNHYGIPATFYVTAGHIDSAAAPWYMRLRHAFMRTTKRSWSWPERPADIIPLTTALERRAAFAYATRRCVRLKTRSRECLVVRIEQELGTTTGLRGSDYLMSWPQLRSLVSQGHTVGSHTLTHPNMALLDPEDCGSELTGSKKILDERLPLPVRHFSYPNPALSPEWNHGTTALTRRAGYETAVINTQGNIGTTVDRFALKRLSVPEDPREFESKLSLAMLGVAV